MAIGWPVSLPAGIDVITTQSHIIYSTLFKYSLNSFQHFGTHFNCSVSRTMIFTVNKISNNTGNVNNLSPAARNNWCVSPPQRKEIDCKIKKYRSSKWDWIKEYSFLSLSTIPSMFLLEICSPVPSLRRIESEGWVWKTKKWVHFVLGFLIFVALHNLHSDTRK